jgi:hypothetical protein
LISLLDVRHHNHQKKINMHTDALCLGYEDMLHQRPALLSKSGLRPPESCLWYLCGLRRSDEYPTHERWKSGPTSKITTKHEVKNEEAIIIVLESIAEVDQERVIDLHRRGEGVKGI